VRSLLGAFAPGWTALRQAAPGVCIAIALAAVARGVAHALAQGVGGLPQIPLSPVMCAVLLGMGWRNSIGVPAWASSGLNWAMYRLLRVGIALIGLRLTLGGATAIAATALPVALSCLTVALLAGIGIARLLAVPRRLGLLLAIGTAVCGCTRGGGDGAAYSGRGMPRRRSPSPAWCCSAVSPCCFIPGWRATSWPPPRCTPAIFLGTAIHDTLAGDCAALIYSQQAAAPAALAAASVAKLLRNLSIAVLVPAAAWLARRHEARSGAQAPAGPGTRALPDPLFVLAFVGFIVVRTAGDTLWHGSATLWPALITPATAPRMCSSPAHDRRGPVGFVHRHVAHRLAARAAGLVVATLVGACSLLLTLAMLHFVT